MDLFVTEIVNSILQIAVFGIIPYVYWLVTARKHRKLAEWIGLKKIEGGKKTIISIILVSFIFMVLGGLTLYALNDVEIATSKFTGLGAIAIPSIVIYATFNTSFPEELIFRGFILKRLLNKFSFNIANFIQALLFGLLHGVMFFALVGVIKTILIIMFTGAIAWFMGYINEKYSNGSILPSWIIHAIANLFSGICAAFLII